MVQRRRAWETYVQNLYTRLTKKGKRPSVEKLHKILLQEGRYRSTQAQITEYLKKLKKANERFLERIYFNPSKSPSFTGPQKLYKFVKLENTHDITFTEIKRWLQNQNSYSLSRSVKRNFKRNVVLVEGLDSQWDADLADVSQLADYNNGIHFLLLCVDILSRYVWVRPLKNKSGSAVADGFKSIFDDDGRKPRVIRTDGGRDFNNGTVKAYLSSMGVAHFSTHNETQANYAESSIRSIKTKLWRYLMYSRGNHYENVLQDLVKSHNDTEHGTTLVKPSEITKQNEKQVWWFLYYPRKYRNTSKKARFQFKLGDTVRISHKAKPFRRQYGQKWTKEVFKISKRFIRQAQPFYRVTDFDDEIIKGSFYEPELQKTAITTETVWEIDQVLDEKTVNGKKQYLVSWSGFSKKFNSWIDAKQFVDHR